MARQPELKYEGKSAREWYLIAKAYHKAGVRTTKVGEKLRGVFNTPVMAAMKQKRK